MTLHFLNVVDDVESRRSDYVILASLKSESEGKLINRIP